MQHLGPIFVTGGAGFIGSHTCKLLHEQGWEVIVYDNLSTGREQNIRWGKFYRGDITDECKLNEAIASTSPKAVIHFAGSAYVGESTTDPLHYYRNNISGTLRLLEAMRKNGVNKLVFSSSCATYGSAVEVPILESTSQLPINPYGYSKLVIENILKDCARAYGIDSIVLRYFNASGADPEGQLGEHHDPETHLIPRCLQAAMGLISSIDVFGGDYNTIDGSCVRDYIHVNDLATAHIFALNYVSHTFGWHSFNLGTGIGHSVFQIINCVERILGIPVPYQMRERREGDPPVLIADGTAAKTILNFVPKHSSIENIVKTAARQYLD